MGIYGEIDSSPFSSSAPNLHVTSLKLNELYLCTFSNVSVIEREMKEQIYASSFNIKTFYPCTLLGQIDILLCFYSRH